MEQPSMQSALMNAVSQAPDIQEVTQPNYISVCWQRFDSHDFPGVELQVKFTTSLPWNSLR